MRSVRFCLMLLAMCSLALLPGPAHALTHAHPAAHAHLAAHHHHDHFASATKTTPNHHTGCPGHHHGPPCDEACCAPACSIYAPPTTAAIRIGHAQAQPMPTSDRPRPDADRPRSLRPPETA